MLSMKKLLTCCFIFLVSLLTAQQREIDSLRLLTRADKEDTLKVKHLNKLAGLYADQGDMKKALDCGINASLISERLFYPSGLAKAYSNLANTYYLQGDYANALYYYAHSLDFTQRIGNKSGAAAIITNMGLIYDAEGKLPDALANFFKALKLAEEANDKRLIAMCTGNIGDAYLYQDDYPQALLYFLKSFKLYETIGNKNGETYNLECIGNVYFKKRDYPKALDYYRRALKISEEINDKRSMSSALGNIGRVYAADSNYKQAMNYFNSVLEQSEKMGNEAEVAKYVYNIGQVYLDEKKYKTAEQYISKSVKLADSIDFKNMENEGNERLSELYAKTGQWQKAYQSYKKYTGSKDSLFNADKSKQLGKLEAKFEDDKQLTLQRAEEEKNKALSEAESKKQRIILLLVATIAGSIALIALLILRLWRTTRKEKLNIEKQKIAMELKALRAQMNPHFIFNAINSIQHFILNNDSKAAHLHLSKFSQLIRKVLENSRFESIPLAEEIRMLELYLELESLRFSSKFHYQISVDSSIDSENVLISPLIIQPFVENAIWHGLMHLKDKQGEVLIKFEKINGSLKCTINDNGIGRKRSMELKKGTMHESMGLSIAKERLQIVNMLNKAKTSIVLIDKTNNDGTPSGTIVELFMPVIINKLIYA
jgi:tetratricopeptide (TPR) repeat protein